MHCNLFGGRNVTYVSILPTLPFKRNGTVQESGKIVVQDPDESLQKSTYIWITVYLLQNVWQNGRWIFF